MTQLGQWETGRWLNEDQRWVAPGGLPDLRVMDTITLNKSLFDMAVAFPNGFLPSGIVLGVVTAAGATQGQYGIYSDAAVDGREVAVGFLGVSVAVSRLSPATQRIQAALYWRGEVLAAYLPTGHGLDAAARVDLAAKFRII